MAKRHTERIFENNFLTEANRATCQRAKEMEDIIAHLMVQRGAHRVHWEGGGSALSRFGTTEVGDLLWTTLVGTCKVKVNHVTPGSQRIGTNELNGMKSYGTIISSSKVIGS